MSSKSLVKVLRRIIREEVRSAVKEVLTEQTVKRPIKQVIKNRTSLSELTNVKSKKPFSKNSMLNDILNETADSADFGSMKEGPLVLQDEYPSVGSFKSDMAESFGTVRQTQALATTGINGEPVNMQNEKVAKTVNIMTKDYSGLMKAIDKKKGK